jgi:hypothetical protein
VQLLPEAIVPGEVIRRGACRAREIRYRRGSKLGWVGKGTGQGDVVVVTEEGIGVRGFFEGFLIYTFNMSRGLKRALLLTLTLSGESG